MHPDLEIALQLQSVDQRIAELEKEISILPQHIARAGRALERHQRKLEADKAALAANQKDRKRLEGEIQTQEQKIAKLKEQEMLAKTNEQMWAFQHEISFCRNEIRKLEDRILQLMEESEPLERNVKAAENALEEERKQVALETKQARERAAADQKALEESRRQRQELVEKLSPAVYAAYERIRKKWKGIAVAEATDGRCNACQIALRPQFFQDLKRMDQVMFCESCGRLLYTNPPVVVEEAAGSEPSYQDQSAP